MDGWRGECVDGWICEADSGILVLLASSTPWKARLPRALCSLTSQPLCSRSRNPLLSGELADLKQCPPGLQAAIPSDHMFRFKISVMFHSCLLSSTVWADTRVTETKCFLSLSTSLGCHLYHLYLGDGHVS